MKFMVVETFRAGCRDAVYERFRTTGQMLPEGLVYISSWVSCDGKKCFQLMEAKDVDMFTPWVADWDDLAEFEVIPVEDSPTGASG